MKSTFPILSIVSAQQLIVIVVSISLITITAGLTLAIIDYMNTPDSRILFFAPGLLSSVGVVAILGSIRDVTTCKTAQRFVFSISASTLPVSVLAFIGARSLNPTGKYLELWEAVVTCYSIASVIMLVLLAKLLSNSTKILNHLQPTRPRSLIGSSNSAPVKYMQMQDHYVRVVTTVDEQLLHMRMRDAVSLLKDDNGAQVHRSYWVNWHHVREIKKDRNRISLIMDDGFVIPVSNSRRVLLSSSGINN